MPEDRKFTTSGDGLFHLEDTIAVAVKVKACVDPEDECNWCHESLFKDPLFFDASIPLTGGKWAWLCMGCFNDLGCRTGVGLGQCYDSKTLVKQILI